MNSYKVYLTPKVLVVEGDDPQNLGEFEIINKLEITKEKEFYEILAIFKRGEHYSVKIFYPKIKIEKSFKFVEGEKIIEKKKVSVKESNDIKKVRGWILDILIDISNSHYKKSEKRGPGMELIKKDMVSLRDRILKWT
ncbi:MAG: hypothetical protein NUV97_03030 [archaeon]|nr:hypothetical protein [archaeon]MCR4324045.1 hypothetical protein [Nanoarchaeota archaeon]